MSLSQVYRFDLELKVLASYFYEPEHLSKFYPLTESFFEHKDHKLIFKLTKASVDNGYVNDMPRRIEELSTQGITISSFVKDLISQNVERCVSAPEYIDYCLLIDQMNLKKNIISKLEKNNDVNDIVEEINAHNEKKTFKNMGSTTNSFIDYLDVYNQKKANNSQNTIITDYDLLDSIVNFQKKHLFVLGARPSIGKSALALNIAHNAAMFNIKTLFLSIEMDTNSLIDRLVSIITRVPSSAISRGNVDVSAVASALEPLQIKNTLLIKEVPSLTTDQIPQLASGFSPDLIVVDYIQIIKDGHDNPSNRNQNENTRISLICNQLQKIAKELNCGIIALSQLNRDNEKLKRRPALSDLRDSGAIEACADIVALLHRDTRQSTTAVLEIAKNRHGACGLVSFNFDPTTTKFDEMSKLDQSIMEENQF